MNPKRHLPIALFDSGLGGLTVMKELRRLCPKEDLLYFGDTARVPYGNRSPDAIRQFALESVSFLHSKEIKLLVIACNTVASWALPEIKALMEQTEVIDVVSAGAKAASSQSQTQKIGLLATRATVLSKSYLKALSHISKDAILHPIACPLFVPLVEEGFIDHPATRLIAEDYLGPLLFEKIDLLLLGCTHYPALKPLLKSLIGPKVKLVDSAESTAQEVEKILMEQELCKTGQTGTDRFFVTDDAEKFEKLAPHFYGKEIKGVETVSLEELSKDKAALVSL